MKNNKNVNTAPIKTEGGSVRFGDDNYYFNDLSIAYNEVYKEQVNLIENLLNSFKPKTALEQLTELDKNISAREKIDNILKSKISFLILSCKTMMQDGSDELSKEYIKCYNLNKEDVKLKEIACLEYFKLKEIDPAQKLVDEILLTDEFNAVAWVVKIHCKNTDTLKNVLKDVPKTTLNDLKFKRLLYFTSIKKSEKYIDVLDAFNEFDIMMNINQYDNSELTFENFKERVFLLECALKRFMTSIFITFNKKKNESSDDLQSLQKLLNDFTASLENSEIKSLYSGIYFFKNYLDYLLNDKKESVHKMKDYFDLISDKRGIILLMANSFQQIEEYDTALAIINEQEEKAVETIDLEMFCLILKNDKDGYVKSAKELLTKINEINETNAYNIFQIPETLNQFDKIKEFTLEEFIGGKTFKEDYLKDFLIALFKIYKNEDIEDVRTILKNISNLIPEENISLLSLLAYSFFKIKEYKLAADVYEKVIDKNEESFELLSYILARYNANIKHSELLTILEKWRTYFSFNAQLLHIEIDLRRKVSDWNNLLKCCEKIIENKKNDEFVITNYAIALHETNSLDKVFKFQSLISYIQKLEFKAYYNANTTAQILLRNGYQKEAFEIYYIHAQDESNSQARLDYFFTCVKMPKDTLRNYNVIELGHFVKYEMNGQVFFIEITENHKYTPFLLGKKVNDLVEIGRELANRKHEIRILRIMNKYLALHDKILKEVDTDPLTEIEMEAYDMSEHMGEGKSIIEFFEKLGANDKEINPEKNFDDYYDHKLSFSEMILCEYSENYIRAYYNLRYDKKGLTQIAITDYPLLNLNKYKNIILDFTSILSFFEIYKKYGFELKMKFTITKSTKTIIRSYREEMTLFNGQGYILDRNFYDELLAWIDRNCEEKIAVTKLDILSNQELKSKNGIFENYIFDNMSLLIELEDSILVSDDMVYLKFFPLELGRFINSNFFMLKLNGNK
jgi:hypothetical protein